LQSSATRKEAQTQTAAIGFANAIVAEQHLCASVIWAAETRNHAAVENA
jgi:hypothetical protein